MKAAVHFRFFVLIIIIIIIIMRDVFYLTTLSVAKL